MEEQHTERYKNEARLHRIRKTIMKETYHINRARARHRRRSRCVFEWL